MTTAAPTEKSTVSTRASSRSAAPLTMCAMREKGPVGSGSMNWAALTIPNGMSSSHSACVHEPDVQRPQWNASSTCPSGGRTSRPCPSVGRKARDRSSPATWRTRALPSIASGGVPLTPCTRSSHHEWTCLLPRPWRRGPCHPYARLAGGAAGMMLGVGPH